ncbi:MAG: hypothetical protein JW902_18395 [Syntrophaceae bacterium]|nr:hypothetical protein [Syntrophaceae bacterium]
MAQVEKNHILTVLNHMEGNLTRAAAILQVSLSTLKRKIKIYRMTEKVHIE